MSLEDIDQLTRRQIFIHELRGDKLYFETSQSAHNWSKNTIGRAILRLLENPSRSEAKDRNIQILVSYFRELR